MSELVLVSIIGGITTIIGAYIAYRKEIKIKSMEKSHKVAIKTVETRSAALENILKFEVFTKLSQAVNDIFDNTCADRFLILFATNGKTNTDTVSVIFEQHQDKEGVVHVNAMAQYHEIRVDEGYIDILKRSEREDTLLLSQEELGSSVLGKIYKAEGIYWSIFKFLERRSINEDDDILTFSSCATHETEMPENDQVYISSKYGYIKSLIRDITD